MKKLLLTIATCVPTIVIYAQQSTNKLPAGHNNPITKEIFSKQINSTNSAAKTTAKHLRFIASAYFDNGQIRDTAHYYYSSDRGSTHSNHNSYYDTYFAADAQAKQTMKPDSSKMWYNNNGTAQLYESKKYKYDASNNVVQQTRDVYMKMSYDIAYDNQGRKTTVTMSDSFGTGIFQPTSKRFYFYDNQNRVVLDSGHHLISNQPTYKQELTYDASGNLIQSSSYTFNSMTNKWTLYYMNTYAYDNNNRMVESLTQEDYNYTGTMKNSSLDSFQYDGNSTKFNYDVNYQWNASLNKWVGNIKHTYQFNAAGFVDTYYIFDWSQAKADFDLNEMEVCYYDANGNNLLQYARGFKYLGAGQFSTTADNQQNFYYEEYYDLGVENTAHTLKLNVYPNPVSNTLNIEMEKPLSGSANIHSIDGKLLKIQSINAENRISIDVSNLAGGNYILQLHNNADNIRHVTQFSK
jgi:hypothetical protein